jgi:hypothetical protein
MADRRVDEEVPEAGEQQQGGELHPLGEGAGDQCGGYDREGELVGDPEELGQALGQGMGRVRPHTVEEQRLHPADHIVEERWRGPERQAVAGDEPEHSDQGHHRHRLRGGGDDVFLPDHAAVEQRQPGQSHQQHERGGAQDPGRAGGVELKRDLVV